MLLYILTVPAKPIHWKLKLAGLLFLAGGYDIKI